jgi:hypothetical protein
VGDRYQRTLTYQPSASKGSFSPAVRQAGKCKEDTGGCCVPNDGPSVAEQAGANAPGSAPAGAIRGRGAGARVPSCNAIHLSRVGTGPGVPRDEMRGCAAAVFPKNGEERASARWTEVAVPLGVEPSKAPGGACFILRGGGCGPCDEMKWAFVTLSQVVAPCMSSCVPMSAGAVAANPRHGGRPWPRLAQVGTGQAGSP